MEPPAAKEVRQLLVFFSDGLSRSSDFFILNHYRIHESHTHPMASNSIIEESGLLSFLDGEDDDIKSFFIESVSDAMTGLVT